MVAKWNKIKIKINVTICIFTIGNMPISDQEFLTDPKSPLKKSYL